MAGEETGPLLDIGGIGSTILGSVIGTIIIFIPVHLAVMVLGGSAELKKSFLIVLGVNLINGLVLLFIGPLLPFKLLELIIKVVISTIIYMIGFELSPIKAFFVGIIATVIMILALILFGGLLILGT